MRMLRNLKNTIFENPNIIDILNEACMLNHNITDENITKEDIERLKKIPINEIASEDFSRFYISLENSNSFKKISKQVQNFYFCNDKNTNKFFDENFDKAKASEITVFQRKIKDTFSNVLGKYILFHNNGQRVIKFQNEALIEQLGQTDITKISFRDLSGFDLKSFYISIEKKVKLFGNENDLFIDGVFVTIFKDTISFNTVMKSKIVFNSVTSKNSLYAFDNDEFILQKDEDFKMAIDEKMNSITKAFNEEKQKGVSASISVNNAKKTTASIKYGVEFAINTMMFYSIAKRSKEEGQETLMTFEAEDSRVKNLDKFIKGVPKKSQLKRAKTVADANYYYILKNNTESNKTIQDDINNNKEDSRVINKAFWVRGHYRNQPIGKRDSKTKETKKILIEAYLKGKDFAIQDDNKMKIEVL
ncbi:hypothetical protein [Poseidonibacter ostreae]|uniref:Uncharacterized protein n=1 Tax=Poseidonibacter ostreae TaxID=2654171 RepID=A0A6L4WX35_9BACT|nr:hypothetical protein [Poseidonibacter ostreae]KAB7891441.1 hypothetical protein GBG19_00970 [Poseidonibacter ostreae]